ncbi:uncharacterized protein BO88DRAFT_434422 [Aspergillus vadensis CBS 113365]|uniref:Uncharacterized protein n=1 Tax=Aspergillus vadensis (strain CBS 113365 / IMI 142717 / IBT 24658) TaxID=1448311 RepID=A0A319BB24_ASPVC|nr:hypothetical protein BO88DRAFT_434422 [Aspergillus vadensis CBS 113365]PYH70196.1 hypothetical protein BO88DRAFT_434422 [Aspergillus vadensis CBS 113365]
MIPHPTFFGVSHSPEDIKPVSCKGYATRLQNHGLESGVDMAIPTNTAPPRYPEAPRCLTFDMGSITPAPQRRMNHHRVQIFTAQEDDTNSSKAIAEYCCRNSTLEHVFTGWERQGASQQYTKLWLEMTPGNYIGDCHLIMDPWGDGYSSMRGKHYLPTYLVLLRIRLTERQPKQQAATTAGKQGTHGATNQPITTSPSLRNRINHKAQSLEGTTTVPYPTNQDTRRKRS